MLRTLRSSRLALPLVAFAWYAAVLPAQSRPDPEPGIRAAGVFSVVEHSANGDVTSVALHASEMKVNLHPTGDPALDPIAAGVLSTVETKGVSADLKIATATPAIYVHASPDDGNEAADASESLALVALRPTQTSRVVFTFTSNFLGWNHKRRATVIATKQERLPTGYLKITPVSPLPPGEFGLIYLLKDMDAFSSRIWDFSVPAK